MPTILRQRRDTAANWTTNDPVIPDGQLCFDTTNSTFKIGDGVTSYSSLPVQSGTAGTDGADGTDGATWLSGSVDPTTEGVDGDFYINTSSYEYFKKITGTWTSQGNLKGADGTLSGLLGADLQMNGFSIIDPVITGLITEQVSVSTLTLGATSSVQTYTATADFTIVDDLESGEFVTMILTNGGFTPTYPTITWWDDAEPTLGTTDKLFFEKIGSTLYGTHVSSIA